MLDKSEGREQFTSISRKLVESNPRIPLDQYLQLNSYITVAISIYIWLIKLANKPLAALSSFFPKKILLEFYC